MMWLRIVFAVLFIFLGAKIDFHVPIQELNIPITGQSFAVLFVGYVLGWKEGVLAVALYLILGGLGLPIFAYGYSGWEVFLKGSGGFLIGFLFGVLATGICADTQPLSFFKALMSTMLGTLIILGIGVAWLTHLYNFEKALAYGFYPFWIGAIVKIVLGAVAGYFGRKFVLSKRYQLLGNDE